MYVTVTLAVHTLSSLCVMLFPLAAYRVMLDLRFPNLSPCLLQDCMWQMSAVAVQYTLLQ